MQIRVRRHVRLEAERECGQYLIKNVRYGRGKGKLYGLCRVICKVTIEDGYLCRSIARELVGDVILRLIYSIFKYMKFLRTLEL